MGNAAFNAFRHELCQTVLRCTLALGEIATGRLFLDFTRALEVALAGALCHCGERTHAAICLERSSLVENRLSRALIHARKERADHDCRSARSYGLRDIAGVLDAAVGDYGNPALASRAVTL